MGLKLNPKKTQVYRKGGVLGTELEDAMLARGIPLPADPGGVIIAGNALGSFEFMERFALKSVARFEAQVETLHKAMQWGAANGLETLQGGLKALTQCLIPQSAHLLRTTPPDVMAAAARQQMRPMWQPFTSCRA